MRHGKGTLEDSKGVRSTGMWVSDKRDGEFEVQPSSFVCCGVVVYLFVASFKQAIWTADS